MLPSVGITKLNANTGVVSPSAEGILAIIAPSSSGTANQPLAVTKAGNAVAAFGYGFLPEAGALMMAATGNPVVLVKGAGSTAASYGAVTFTGTGTSVVTATGTPYDDFQVLVTIVTGGTRGTDGITYTYSLDGGLNTSAVTALGTATSISIPNSGVTLALAAGTLIAGDTAAVTATGPRLTTGDISAALESLRTSSLPYEFVLIGGHDATKTTVDLLDAWTSGLESSGKFKGFLVNSRMKNAGETEATFATAMATAWAQAASIRGCVGADGGDVVSALPARGVTQKRPTALALASRLMNIPYGQDAALVATGPLNGFGLADAAGNTKNHDENLYPTLDDLRLVTLRTFERRAGTFITNPNTIAVQGSDFVYAQHIRCMNRACELAFDVLSEQLSLGVDKNPKLGPNNEVYVSEVDLRRIDDAVNAALNELRSEVSDISFRMSRLDDVGANGPARVSGDLSIQSKAYLKKINVNGAFVRTISAALNP